MQLQSMFRIVLTAGFATLISISIASNANAELDQQFKRQQKAAEAEESLCWRQLEQGSGRPNYEIYGVIYIDNLSRVFSIKDYYGNCRRQLLGTLDKLQQDMDFYKRYNEVRHIQYKLEVNELVEYTKYGDNITRNVIATNVRNPSYASLTCDHEFGRVKYIVNKPSKSVSVSWFDEDSKSWNKPEPWRQGEYSAHGMKYKSTYNFRSDGVITQRWMPQDSDYNYWEDTTTIDINKGTQSIRHKVSPKHDNLHYIDDTNTLKANEDFDVTIEGKCNLI